ncbi:unnamed protein product [Choristocarpus tenellus]
MGGGAWPFLVDTLAHCLVNSSNKRGPCLLNRGAYACTWGNNRPVMPFDVLGRTRATLMHATRFV